MNLTGRCGHDCACAAVDKVRTASAAVAAAKTIEFNFDIRLSRADAATSEYRKPDRTVNARASSDVLLHVVSTANAWSNISDHGR
jgi:hypothetical protein